MNANKKLGQNYLIDKNKINKILQSLPDLRETLVIEMGPGKGALTFPLSEIAEKVLAIEIDKELSSYLESKNKRTNLVIINEDFLEINLKTLISENKKNSQKIHFVSNLPYYISTKTIFLVSQLKEIESISVMLQKELVDRIVSSPNSKKYGRLTVAINSFFDIITKISVPKGCFNPKPKVDSAFIVLKRKDLKIDQKKYLDFIKKSFAHKRKTLLNSLKHEDLETYKLVHSYLLNNKMPLNIRAEQIEVKKFIKIYKDIKK